MEFIKLISRQTFFVALITSGVVALGWFLSQDINRSIVVDNSGSSVIPTEDTAPPEFGVVSDVVDSFTIILNDKYTVRYLGVTTPTILRVVECFGKEAVQANESILNKTVRLEEDPTLTRAADGAWLRYVWVAEDAKSEEAYKEALSGAPVAGLDIPAETSVNAETEDGQGSEIDASEISNINEADQPNEIKEYLVAERIIEMGLGFPLLSKEMVYYDRLSGAARFSSATKRGLWGVCEIQENEQGLLRTQQIDECIIKGVELRDGKRIYRTPSCAAYENTVVRLYENSSWLCSEEEAIEKGYEKALDC